MTLQLSRQGKVYYNGTTNVIAEIGTRVTSTTDAINSFYDRYKILTGYLYGELTADVPFPTEPGSSAFNIFCAGCNEVSLQPIGNAGTVSVKGSLDGVTFVNAVTTVGTDGIIRITAKYKWLQVSTSGSSGTYSIYMMIS